MTVDQEQMSWDNPDAGRYTSVISRKIPGYYGMYEMMECFLASQVEKPGGQSCKLFVAGAGGGQELLTLGLRHPDWSFFGVDPSASMLKAARVRVEEAGLSERVTFLCGEVEDLPQEVLYHGATCMLVLHFVRGREQKVKLLRGIAERLVPGAPLVLSSINGIPSSRQFAIQMQAWQRHMMQQGIPREEWDRFEASFGPNILPKGSDPVSSDEVPMLLEEAGFADAVRFFGAFLIEGYAAFRKKA
ncbi:class I SAM-dependent methyltransferase [Gorillibacterium sp. CAU 1737]|uniref:class I SAM-dependent methyltransferase n=1 Tax=Gorillibacterium sp. CAU 1737 TaxID=3140362 RepID=UPI003261BF2F